MSTSKKLNDLRKRYLDDEDNDEPRVYPDGTWLSPLRSGCGEAVFGRGDTGRGLTGDDRNGAAAVVGRGNTGRGRGLDSALGGRGGAGDGRGVTGRGPGSGDSHVRGEVIAA